MPKSLAFGNGTTHITVDRFARLRDLYFPYVGLENHIGGAYAHRVGVFTEGNFSWTDDGSWDISITSNDAYQGILTLYSRNLGLTLLLVDTLSHSSNLYIRRYFIKNERKGERTIKLFINQQFEIYQSEKGDTAYFDPESHAIIHYEGKRAFVIGMKQSDRMFDDYSVGIFQIEGKEGTYKDAEDGMLSKNTIEHGRVDSVVAQTIKLEEGKPSVPVYYWIAIGSFIDEAREIHSSMRDGDPQITIDESAKFWNAWVHRLHIRFYGLSEQVITLFDRSQLYLRAHVDHRGAIIASGDSDMLINGRDTYSYMWPRDASYVATALDMIGDRHNARIFFEFCTSVISDKGYFMHKYRPDKALGSSWHGWMVEGHPELPIQEDETALVLWALWQHWESSQDLDFISSIYHKLIRPAGEFLLRHRDPHTGLPKPSYNLWEEKFAIHTYTAASVYAALDKCSRFAVMLGDDEFAVSLTTARDKLQSAIIEHCLVDGSFIRSIYLDEQGGFHIDKTCDASSAYGVFIFGVLPVEDERLRKAVAFTRSTLAVETPVGGLARYERDQYHRHQDKTPGNPWIIISLWYAQYDILSANSDQDLDVVRSTLNWVESHATRSGILPEQLDPYTNEHLSTAPLVWSHAEYIRTVMMYLQKVKELKII
jgi:GH15 family glucan-1,4-alpha-glucosidase